MACNGLAVILDTSVFVCCFKLREDYGNIINKIREDGFYIVICPSIRQEYVRHMYGRSASSHWLVRQHLDDLQKDGVLVYARPIEENEIEIQRKDQHVIDCAFNKTCRVHLIITDNAKDFVSKTKQFRIPVIVQPRNFLEKNNRENLCSEIRRLLSEEKKIGKSVVIH